MGAHFKGKWELLESLREPRGGTEKSLTRQYRRSCVALVNLADEKVHKTVKFMLQPIAPG